MLPRLVLCRTLWLHGVSTERVREEEVQWQGTGSGSVSNASTLQLVCCMACVAKLQCSFNPVHGLLMKCSLVIQLSVSHQTHTHIYIYIVTYVPYYGNRLMKTFVRHKAFRALVLARSLLFLNLEP